MTGRERQVIETIADGMSNKEIADRLGIATHTVKSHVHNILEKLALHTRLEVAIYAHDQGAKRRSLQCRCAPASDSPQRARPCRPLTK